MQRTLITFVGTNDYSETLYEWTGLGEHRSAFVAVALSKFWGSTRVIALATETAESKNGERLRHALTADNLPAPEFIRLADGRTDRELWAQFQTIREAIEGASGGEILIDITHGFRAQPFFAGAILSVLRAADIKPTKLRVVYGEYRQNETVSPIWDLTLFADLMDWAQALSLFLRTGVASLVVDLSRQMQQREVQRVKSSGLDFPRFAALTNGIEQFATDLATIRVASIITGYAQEDKKKAKARGSASVLLRAIEQCQAEIARKLPPLALILDRLAAEVRPLIAERLFSEEGRRAQSALASLYLKLGRYPEAAVVIREATVSQHAQDERAVEVNSPLFDQSQRLAADKRFSDEDFNAQEIGDIRNDIEHGGFRKQPADANTLRGRIEGLLHGQMPSTKQPRERSGRTFLVTRHPGAVEWAAHHDIRVDRVVPHLDISEIRAGDSIIGTLPVHLASEVCSKRARYLHLILDLPPDYRGVELTAEDMDRFGARISEHQIRTVSGEDE